jgi:uncharacterized membrane protein
MPIALRTASAAPVSRGWHIGSWLLQGLLGLTFAGTGVWKLVTPVADLAGKMPWMGQVSPGFLYVTAVLDVLGGLGLVLPAATGIRPQLTVLAALGCAALMAGAALFHVTRGEASSTPFNFVMLGLCLLVAWGRHAKARLAPRSSHMAH